MKSGAVRNASSILLTIILLVGCNGSQPDLAPSTSLARAPDAGRSGPLLYVSDISSRSVYVFSLPGGSLIQTITGFIENAGLCSDKEGHVFVVDSEAHGIKEYAHGGREPIAVLNDPLSTPVGCSVDPTTGNLAVTSQSTTSSGGHSAPGSLAIYTKARGTPKHYADRDLHYFAYDSYDGGGNLYVDGVSRAYESAFAVLVKGAHKLRSISVNQSIENYAPVRWDGQYLAVASGNYIYRFKIKGTSGTKAGTVRLDGASAVYDFWIQNSIIYAPVISNQQTMVGVYPYPRGGRPTKSLLGFAAAFSATVSVLP